MAFSEPQGISRNNFSTLCKQNDPGDFMVASPALLIGIANMELEAKG